MWQALTERADSSAVSWEKWVVLLWLESWTGSQAASRSLRQKKKKEEKQTGATRTYGLWGNLHLLIKLVGNHINNNWQWMRMKLIIHLLYEALFGNPLPPPKILHGGIHPHPPRPPHPATAAAAVKAVTGEKKLFIMYSSWNPDGPARLGHTVCLLSACMRVCGVKVKGWVSRRGASKEVHAQSRCNQDLFFFLMAIKSKRQLKQISSR